MIGTLTFAGNGDIIKCKVPIKFQRRVFVKQTCPICEKHCIQSEIGCKKGEKYFSYGVHHDSQASKLVALFYKCTHLFLHRNGQDQGKNRVLSILLKHGNMTQRELLDHTDIRSASLSELLSKIEANGDIQRKRSDEDARNVNIMLTDKGKVEAKQILNEQLQFAKELFSALNQEEQEQLEKLLVKLLLSWKSDRKKKE